MNSVPGPLAFLAHDARCMLVATAVCDCIPLHFHRAFWERYSAMARILRDTHPVPINCLMSSEQFRPAWWFHSILRSETTCPRCSSCRLVNTFVLVFTVQLKVQSVRCLTIICYNFCMILLMWLHVDVCFVRYIALYW